jgi:hypothetical protein
VAVPRPARYVTHQGPGVHAADGERDVLPLKASGSASRSGTASVSTPAPGGPVSLDKMMESVDKSDSYIS